MDSSLTPVCANMPSAIAARDYMAGIPGSTINLLGSYVGRAAIVATGMYLAGKRKHLLRDALAGTAVIEAMVLLYFSSEENRKNSSIITQRNVAKLLQGHGQYLIPVLTDIILRASEIGTGMYLAGSRERNIRDALAGSTAVELFVIMYSIFGGEKCIPGDGVPLSPTPWPIGYSE